MLAFDTEITVIEAMEPLMKRSITKSVFIISDGGIRWASAAYFFRLYEEKLNLPGNEDLCDRKLTFWI